LGLSQYSPHREHKYPAASLLPRKPRSEAIIPANGLGTPIFVSGTSPPSGEDAIDDVAVHVSQAAVDATVAEGELFVVDA
jgi:hypothetical protein